MDGSFACPECGGIVELRGLAPGRQVRCGFCQQLLEIPYLPRVPSGSRGRRRAWPKWAVWVWAAIGLSLAVILVWGGVRSWSRHQRSLRTASIDRIFASSEAHEQAGRLDEALTELDAALGLAREFRGSHPEAWAAQRRRRPELARRDAEAMLDRLAGEGPSSLPLGEWLSLIARSRRDPDLEPLRPRVVQGFRSMVGQEIDRELASAGRAFAGGKVRVALQGCDRIAKLLGHLDAPGQKARRRATEELVTRLLGANGVVVEPIQGEFLFGSPSSFTKNLLPVVVKGLEGKGYLPYRAESPWAELWKQSVHRLQIHITEQKEGYYLSSRSRLTLVRVHLTMTASGVKTWERFPGARARVPVPNLPGYRSGGMAIESAPEDEVERLLYKDALGQLNEKVSLALTSLPECAPERR